jgi:glycosyltransferase involved in cell wall biosynthesis
MPLVSVVIPSYNCARYLPEAIESVLGQSLSDLEVIVVDDGSTDDTKQVVSRYLSDGRLQYVFQENRGAPSAARNRGAALAQGEFIASLDSDDLLAPTALEEEVAALKASNASWCITDIVKFWEGHQEVRQTQFPVGDLAREIFRDDFVRVAMFFRKDALVRVGMWDESLRRDDWDLNIRLLANGEPFAYVNRPLYQYRRRPGSVTTSDPGLFLTATERLLRKHHKPLADAGDKVLAEIYAAHMWELARSHFFRRKDLMRASHCVWESSKYDFNLVRLFHPLIHHARLGLAAMKRMTAGPKPEKAQQPR